MHHKVWISALKAEGPLVIGGNFGSNFYSKPPQYLEKIKEKYNKFGWVAGAERVEILQSHVVIVVRARKSKSRGGGSVYFLDPEDPSNPGLEKENLYAISYQNVIDNIKEFTNLHYFALRSPGPRE